MSKFLGKEGRYLVRLWCVVVLNICRSMGFGGSQQCFCLMWSCVCCFFMGIIWISIFVFWFRSRVCFIWRWLICCCRFSCFCSLWVGFGWRVGFGMVLRGRLYLWLFLRSGFWCLMWRFVWQREFVLYWWWLYFFWFGIFGVVGGWWKSVIFGLVSCCWLILFFWRFLLVLVLFREIGRSSQWWGIMFFLIEFILGSSI